MDSAADILGPGGRIAARLKNYEHRDEQLAMAGAVTAAIERPGHLVVEAGTGVGKSFAYLVPAILASIPPPGKKSGATHRHFHAHDQLAGTVDPKRPAPAAERDAGRVFRGAGEGAGKLRQPAAAGQRPGPGRQPLQRDEEFAQLRQIAAWAKHSGDGSLADLDFRPHPAVWDEVASDHGNCMGRSCPHYKECFYYRARRRVSHAQILVVNHALFFTDLALRREGVSILPNYDVVIFDEAHTLEAVAGDHLGLSISNSQVEFTLRRLYNERTNRGLLVHHRLREAEKRPGSAASGPTASSPTSPPGWRTSRAATAGCGSRKSSRIP